MGLFVLQEKPNDQMTAADYVEVALKNINLWKDHPDCEYLLSQFAVISLQKAAIKIKNDRNK